MSNHAPSRKGFSEKRLELLTRRIDIDIAAKFIPGAVMQIAREGEVVYEKALGVQDPGTGTPMSIDSIFRIYSMTKPIVSLATMMLVEQGRLLLSDPISKFLPELRRLKVGVEKMDAKGVPVLELVDTLQPITVQDLLRHTSGFTYGIFGDSLVKAEYRKSGLGNPRATSDEFIRTLAQLPLVAQPATVWEYSHSTDVLGVMLERITGQSLDELLKERILAPLGMRETGFWVEPEHHHRIAEAFAVDPVTGADVKLNQPRRRPNFLGGGGGMMSTLHDYQRFAQMLLNGGAFGEVRILRPETVALMTRNTLTPELTPVSYGSVSDGTYGFGLGVAVRVDTAGAVRPGPAGLYRWSGYLGTYFWIDPVNELIAMVWTQLSPGSAAAIEARLQGQVYRSLTR